MTLEELRQAKYEAENKVADAIREYEWDMRKIKDSLENLMWETQKSQDATKSARLADLCEECHLKAMQAQHLVGMIKTL